MNSRSDLIAAAVAVLLADAFAGTLAVDRVDQPTYELEDLAGPPVVSVMAAGLESEDQSRAAISEDHEIHVAVQKKLGAGATLDDLKTKAEQITDYLIRTSLPVTGVVFVSLKRTPLYEPDHLKLWQQFTAVLRVIYRGSVAR